MSMSLPLYPFHTLRHFLSFLIINPQNIVLTSSAESFSIYCIVQTKYKIPLLNTFIEFLACFRNVLCNPTFGVC